MTPTPEEIEGLRLSGETLSAIAAKAKRADELEADYRELLARAKIAEAELSTQCQLVKNQANRANYAEEHLTHLAKFIGLHGMTWAHVVSEAVSLIERQKKENDRLRTSFVAEQEARARAENSLNAKVRAIEILAPQVDELTNERDRFRQERDAARGATLATLPEAEVIAIDELKASRRKLRAAIDKACEALGNAIPECRGMSIHELVIEATGRIQHLTSERNDLITDLKLSRELRTSLGASTRETIDRLHGEVLALEDAKSSLMMEVDRLTAELAEARAENGRQAATIAAMFGRLTGAYSVTINTGRDNLQHFRTWMESEPFVSGHEFRPDAWLFSGDQKGTPIDPATRSPMPASEEQSVVCTISNGMLGFEIKMSDGNWWRHTVTIPMASSKKAEIAAALRAVADTMYPEPAKEAS